MNKKIIILITIVLLISAGTLIFNNKFNNESAKKVDVKSTIVSENGEYNIYIINATLPLLFADMNIIQNNNETTYLWYERVGTINEEILTETCSNLILSEYIGQAANQDLYHNVCIEAKNFIKNVLEQDKSAHFNLYVYEYCNWIEFPLFLEQGLSDEQYDVTIYSDGTLSYVINYDIVDENTYEFFKDEKEDYFDTVEKVRSGELKSQYGIYTYLTNLNVSNVSDVEDVSPMEYVYDQNFILISTLRDNVKYYVQYPEMFKFEDDVVAEEMKDANILKIDANQEFNELSDEKKAIFYKSINLDKEKFDEEYFNLENGKYLIVTGANPFYGGYDSEKFKTILESVVNKYGSEYKILYKPHPSALPDEEQTAMLNEFNIEILPGKMPMEAISFVYSNLKLGGFPSSLYMSVGDGQTLFFFAEDKNDMFSPLDILYDDMFGGAEFYN